MRGKILVLGQQAREHALAWRLAQSGHEVFLARSMPFPFDESRFTLITDLDEMRPEGFAEIVNTCRKLEIDCVLIGSTGPMDRGLVDHLEAAGIATLGANLNSVELELSKVFSKAFMRRHGIPTPDYEICAGPAAIEQLPGSLFPCMLKSDRVIRSHYSAVAVASKAEALGLAPILFDTQLNYYAEGGLLLEQFCRGRELSLTVLFDGERWLALPLSLDYKKLRDGDRGPNTSSMGSVTPAPAIGGQELDAIIDTIVEPSVAGIIAEGLAYRGFLYFGVMLTDSGPVLLEYNCRLGDPEAQSLMPLLESDFADAVLQAAQGRLEVTGLRVRDGSVCSVYAVPRGYPDAIECGFPLALPLLADSDPEVRIFAGALQRDAQNQRWLSGNNRVLCVSARGDTLEQARIRAYNKINTFTDDHLVCRADIGLIRESE